MDYSIEYYLIIAIAILVSVCLVGIVLVQNSKGGGLISQLGNANSMAGVAQTTDFVEKATWVLWVALIILSIWSIHYVPGRNKDKVIDNTEVAAPASDDIADEAGE